MPKTIETDLADLIQAINRTTVAVVDFETSSLDTHNITVVSMGVYLPEPDRVFYINLNHFRRDPNFPRFTEQQVIDGLQPFFILPDRLAIFHNASYDLRCMYRMGFTVLCRVADTLINTHRTDENLKAFGREYTNHPHLKMVTYGLKELTTIFYKEKPPQLHEAAGGSVNPIESEIEPVARYCVLDVLNTYRLFTRSETILNSLPATLWLKEHVDNPNHTVLARMMWTGIQVDVEESRRQHSLYQQAIQNCREEIWRIGNLRWAVDTPAQILRYLRNQGFSEELEYDPFWEPLHEGWADPSIAKEALLAVFNDLDPLSVRKRTILALLMAKSQMEQRCSAFLVPLPEKVQHTNGRLYPDRFSSTLVTTRFSTSPNVQNLPKRADKVAAEDKEWHDLLPDNCQESEKTRNVFIAKPGYLLVSADLNTAEPRYLAMLSERALHEHDDRYLDRKKALQNERSAKYPVLMQAMYKTRKPFDPTTVTTPEIVWPKFAHDPLWEAYNNGQDPYNSLLIAMIPTQYQQAVATGTVADWLAENRWRGKLAFLALAYGSTADSLAPKLKWTVAQTQQAIQDLKTTYATLDPLVELTFREMIHTGEVFTLWGRPRRINGYYQLSRPNPVTVCFYRLRPFPTTYIADIIPLGSTQRGVQAFVERCYIESQDGRTGELVMAGDVTTGKVSYMNKNNDPFTHADHFNTPPFRNINFNQIKWVRDDCDLYRHLPRQERAKRQAFNSLCQSTGADHLRWLMNNVDYEISARPEFSDCKLVLTVHDSLLYEIPEHLVDLFVPVVRAIMEVPPPWATLPIKVDVEVGRTFGTMKTV